MQGRSISALHLAPCTVCTHSTRPHLGSLYPLRTAEAHCSGCARALSPSPTARAVRAACTAQMITDLKEAVSRKDQFMSLMSHELRTPLNGIIQLGDALCRGAGVYVRVLCVCARVRVLCVCARVRVLCVCVCMCVRVLVCCVYVCLSMHVSVCRPIFVSGQCACLSRMCTRSQSHAVVPQCESRSPPLVCFAVLFAAVPVVTLTSTHKAACSSEHAHGLLCCLCAAVGRGGAEVLGAHLAACALSVCGCTPSIWARCTPSASI